MRSIFLEHIHHAYAKTNGTYDFPNSREGDMLRRAKQEMETLIGALQLLKDGADDDNYINSVGEMKEIAAKALQSIVLDKTRA